jgi:hypothetical protein
MRRALVLICISFFTVLCIGQDLIVTNTGDSINCKITKVKPDNIYFTFKYKSEIRNTLLPVTDIKTYQQNYYSKSEIPLDKQFPGNFKHLRIGLNGGYSLETAKIDASYSDILTKYYKELRSGFNLGASLTYYFSESLGFGFKYSRFMTSNSIDYVQINLGNGNTFSGKLGDDIKISFYGPSFSTRLMNRNKMNAFIFNYSVGYLAYKDNEVFGGPYKVTGGTFGMDLDLGYDVGISKKLSLGFQLSLVSGILTKYTIDDGYSSTTYKLEKDEYESLYRVDFSIGLRFNK